MEQLELFNNNKRDVVRDRVVSPVVITEIKTEPTIEDKQKRILELITQVEQKLNTAFYLLHASKRS